MIYELRIYRFHPGTKRTFLRGFKLATRFMEKYGMTLVAAWESIERDDEFIWIRAFPSRKAREVSTAKFYSSSEWLAIVKMLRPAIRRREVRLLKLLPFSAGVVRR
jgi:hypothetical protein